MYTCSRLSGFAVLLGSIAPLAGFACAPKPDPLLGESVLLNLREISYEDGMPSIGTHYIIMQSGEFLIRVPAENAIAGKGTLPPDLMNSLSKDISAIKKWSGNAHVNYNYFIDDGNAIHPVSIRMAIDYLYSRP